MKNLDPENEWVVIDRSFIQEEEEEKVSNLEYFVLVLVPIHWRKYQ